MPSGLTVHLMDATARIEIADSVTPGIRATLIEAWAELKASSLLVPDLSVAVAAQNDVGPSSVDVRVAASPEESLGERLTSRLTAVALDLMSGRALMLHASAVALDDGRVIGFVGPSGRGKTTAMTVLARTHRYVTDETLAIAPDGAVIPYPKPLLLGHHPQVKVARSAASLGLRPIGDGPFRLAALVLLDRRDDLAIPVVDHVPLADAMIEIARESSYFTALESPLRMLADLLVTTCGARRLTYSEATTLPAVLDQLISGPAGPQPDVRTVSPLPAVVRGSTGWMRAPYKDALLVDGRLLVLQDQTITVLEGIAPTVWEAAAGTSIAELTKAALDVHPASPDVVEPETIVAAVVEELGQAGLLRRV